MEITNNRSRQVLLLVVMCMSLFLGGCASANEGTASVQTVRSSITRVIRAEHGWVNTAFTIGDDYHEVSLRSFTEEVEVSASTKDNASFKIKVSVTSHIKNTDADIIAYVRKFGLASEECEARIKPITTGHISTEVKNATNKFDAYSLFANQESVQKQIQESLAKIYADQLYKEVESVQIIGRPDFDDNRIEEAASSVVANQKAKEAAEADLARAKVEAEKKQVEAQTFKDPALLQIKLLELKLDIERAKANGIAKHNGPLTIVEGSATQLQLKTQ